MLAWLNAIEAYIETGNELPINLRVRAFNMVTRCDLTFNLVVNIMKCCLGSCSQIGFSKFMTTSLE